jgi:hypothetical protein
MKILKPRGNSPRSMDYLLGIRGRSIQHSTDGVQHSRPNELLIGIKRSLQPVEPEQVENE